MDKHLAIPGSTGAWYSCSGKDDDVILSTRIRLARNLADFPFPPKLQESDSIRIQEIAFDVFNHFENSEKYQAVSVEKLDPLGSRILQERGIIDSTEGKNLGIVMRTDGKVSCTVNVVDHVRISSFVSGFDVDGALKLCREVDEEMQKKIQFAASYDFGYLTTSVKDAGSGMKISFRVHLPSLSALGKIESIATEMSKKNISFSASYGAGEIGSSLGSYYQISTVNCFTGNEFDQIAEITSEVEKIVELERSARSKCNEQMPTNARNQIYRSFGVSQFSKFLTLRESIDLIGGIKWGKDLQLLTGIEYSELHALLYRIQEAHLQFAIKNGNFNFEEDIADNTERKVCRLRALVLQESFEDIHLGE
ncbi:MAG: hypothetical protein WCQ67_02370 [Treponema sp.]